MFTLPDALLYAVDYAEYVTLALGIPGNILSAIVWLRRRVVSKNSSAVFLAALAIVDLAFLLCHMIWIILFDVYTLQCHDYWFCYSAWFLGQAAAILEPLLVLGFSVGRLIAILRPLQVTEVRLCCIYFTLIYRNVS